MTIEWPSKPPPNRQFSMAMLVHWRLWTRSWVASCLCFFVCMSCECAVCLVQNMLGSVLSSKPFRSQRGPPASQNEHRTAETKGLPGVRIQGFKSSRGSLVTLVACHVEETCSKKSCCSGNLIPKKYRFPIFTKEAETQPLPGTFGRFPSERCFCFAASSYLLPKEVRCIHTQMTAHTSWMIHVLITIVMIVRQAESREPNKTPKLRYV